MPLVDALLYPDESIGTQVADLSKQQDNGWVQARRRFNNANQSPHEKTGQENKSLKVSARASGSPGLTNLWRGVGMLREVPGRLGSRSCGGCCREDRSCRRVRGLEARGEGGAAGGIAGWNWERGRNGWRNCWDTGRGKET